MSVAHRLAAWGELRRRYLTVFRYSWANRHVLSLPTFAAQEAEFLPAALSLQALPVSPMGRWVARLLIALIVTLLLWSIFGQIDIIVDANGKIIPGGYTKTITAVEVASVRALHVQEGQTVKAGDVLVELDTRASDSDRDKAEGDWETAVLQAARSRALIAAVEKNQPPTFAPIRDVAPDKWRDAQQQLQAQWLDYVAKRQSLEGEINRYAEALPLATQRANDYADLVKTHDVSEHAWLEKEQARVDLDGQLVSAKNQKAALTADTLKTAQDSLNEALRTMAESSQDERRASVHSEWLKLIAPVDGTVQQLTVHTVGSAVPAAQPLMQIVPKQDTLEVEAFLENKDVGFVREGQLAEVKLDAFEYTKYGTVPAHVSHVSRDAIQDEKRGLIYSVKVALDQTTIDVDGRRVALSPGLSANVDIKTGTRRVIEYVLSPLIQHGRESLHER